MSHVVVTGGCGFIGTKLVLRLVSEGYSVTVIDKDDPELEIVDVHYIKRQLGQNIPLPELQNVDVVYHLAAEARVQKTYDDPLTALDNNTKATLEVLHYARTYNTRRVVYASTSSVYTNHDANLALKEDCNIGPVNPYGISKLHGEEWCRFYGTNTPLDTVCLRFFNVYGEGQKSDGPYTQVTQVFLDQARKGQPLTINGNGNQTRDFTYIDDIVKGIVTAGTTTKYQFRGRPINLGTGDSYSIFDLAKEFHPTGKSYVFNPPKPGENPHDLADNTRARQQLDWKPTMDVVEWMISQL